MKPRKKQLQWSWYSPDVQDLLLKYYKDWLFNTPENADRMVSRILSITGVRPPGRIVDVGCGLGYHAVAFARQGFEVLAFDPGDRYVEITRDHVSQASADVDVRQMQCRDLEAMEKFSLAWAGSYCPGQLAPEEVVRDFRRIRDSLVPGGWFISSVAGKPKVPPSEKIRNWRELSDCYILTEKWADEAYFHEHCRFVYPDRNEVVELMEIERMYGVKEIVPLLEAAGFRQIRTAPNFIDTETPADEGKHFAFWCRRDPGCPAARISL